MHSINFGKVNLQSLDCLHNQNLKKRLAQPSSVGLEFKYKSQEIFSYLALVCIRRLFPDHITHVTFPILFEYLCELAGKWIDSFSKFLLQQDSN